MNQLISLYICAVITKFIMQTQYIVHKFLEFFS